MTGKILAIVIVVCALAAGAGLYYQQVYAYYDDVTSLGEGDVVLTPTSGGDPVPLPHADWQAIDADSSPIRYRSCFSLSGDFDSDGWEPYPGAEPRVAPGWFSCFDAEEIGAALEEGTAKAYLSIKDVHYGIDRVVAILPDGRGFAWHQINHCGEVVFDGQPAPEGCPPPPDGTARR
ncbi:histidine kinase [Oceanicola sp. 22II-s10i]|uniref:DUF6446 family protein n=1 Tax=Oceanicola sp. 22II-s10i TaxID=1317116 RepID=UPI000B528B70|nr:DUF6446 family protein [Oceanicola sp. 22II-s10i]OWU85237.1 histidine kinase [Oceanicola sp. 22II-s10i]